MAMLVVAFEVSDGKIKDMSSFASRLKHMAGKDIIRRLEAEFGDVGPGVVTGEVQTGPDAFVSRIVTPHPRHVRS